VLIVCSLSCKVKTGHKFAEVTVQCTQWLNESRVRKSAIFVLCNAIMLETVKTENTTKVTIVH